MLASEKKITKQIRFYERLFILIMTPTIHEIITVHKEKVFNLNASYIQSVPRVLVIEERWFSSKPFSVV